MAKEIFIRSLVMRLRTLSWKVSLLKIPMSEH
ncbi:hypothetical protein Fluta_0561 [Fluviicola taffensis DSM 16823]|uniref:Uncharacterized protein n=1 Tax=Fluviicola taffensis (strain DSM 16823 / NCIMB 13979 / RW262) TaxID=755732 RepID=F2IGG0_FLUTR|nr:hypothetical protein Fluta_0561 [Fluviicola taffensis DSM 16823]